MKRRNGSNLHGNSPKSINIAVRRDPRGSVLNHIPNQLRSQPPRGSRKRRSGVGEFENIGEVFDDFGYSEIRDFDVSVLVDQNVSLNQASLVGKETSVGQVDRAYPFEVSVNNSWFEVVQV